MKILIVCSGNFTHISPFIREQAEALEREQVEVHYFLVKGRGLLGYLRNLGPLKKCIHLLQPDLIHAHYGLCGMVSVLQRRKPVVITFHGSDINFWYLLPISRFAMRRTSKNIYVAEQLRKKADDKNGVVIPCGIDMSIFKPLDRSAARIKMNLNDGRKKVLFSSAFDNAVKNAALAKKAMEKLSVDADLIELNNYSRQEVALLMNACDAALLTSFSEGSPQFIKEALACGLPVVSTRVGDVEEMIKHVAGCYLVDFDPADVAEKLERVLNNPQRVTASEVRNRFDNVLIAKQIKELYKTAIG